MSFAVNSFVHSGQETSCSSCHWQDRPADTAGFLKLNSNAPFDYSTHAAALDCTECHRPTSAQRSSVDWANGVFKHASSLSSCQDCHSTQRPTTYGNNQAHPTTGDCAGCHLNSMNSDFTQLSDWKGAILTAGTTSFDPLTDISITTGTLSYSTTQKTKVQSVSTGVQTLHMTMNHSTLQVSAANMNSCTLCHAGASTSNYLGGRFHTKLTAAGISQPSNCNECHSTALPANFVGPVDSKRSPASASMKHNAVTWTSNSAGVLSPSSSKLVLNDCKLCHLQNSGSTWAGAKYHASLIAGGVDQPSSCLDCHANSVPTGVVGTSQFDHSLNATGDCVSCHASPTTWAGASGMPASIHLLAPTGSLRPTLTINHPQMGSNVTCSSCHSGGTFTLVKGFDHSLMPSGSACVYCHQSGQRNVLSTVNLAKKSNGHEGSNLNTSDCISCHNPTYPTKSTGSPASWTSGGW